MNSWDHRLGPSCWGLCRPFSAVVPWPPFVCLYSKAEKAIDWELKWLKHHRTQTRASQACWAPKHMAVCVCVCVCLRRTPCGIIHLTFSAPPPARPLGFDPGKTRPFLLCLWDLCRSTTWAGGILTWFGPACFSNLVFPWELRGYFGNTDVTT